LFRAVSVRVFLHVRSSKQQQQHKNKMQSKTCGRLFQLDEELLLVKKKKKENERCTVKKEDGNRTWLVRFFFLFFFEFFSVFRLF